VLGLAASLITFRGLWAAAGVVPPPPPPAVAGDEKVDGEGEKDGEKEARGVVKEADPYAVDSNGGVSESTSSFVEVKAAQV